METAGEKSPRNVAADTAGELNRYENYCTHFLDKLLLLLLHLEPSFQEIRVMLQEI